MLKLVVLRRITRLSLTRIVGIPPGQDTYMDRAHGIRRMILLILPIRKMDPLLILLELLWKIIIIRRGPALVMVLYELKQ